MTQYYTSVGIIHTSFKNADERKEFYLIIDKLRESLRSKYTYQEVKAVALEYLVDVCGVTCRKNANATIVIETLLRQALASDGRWAYTDGKLARVADRLSRVEPHETINPDDQISVDAIEHLAKWACDNGPPLEIIAACDRALYWVHKQRVNEFQQWESDEE